MISSPSPLLVIVSLLLLGDCPQRRKRSDIVDGDTNTNHVLYMTSASLFQLEDMVSDVDLMFRWRETHLLVCLGRGGRDDFEKGEGVSLYERV